MQQLQKMEFCPEAPEIQYHQDSFIIFFLISLALDFHNIGEYRAVTAFENCTEISLTLQKNIFSNRLGFSNDIMKNKLHHKVEYYLRHIIKK